MLDRDRTVNFEIIHKRKHGKMERKSQLEEKATVKDWKQKRQTTHACHFNGKLKEKGRNGKKHYK